MYMSIIYTYAWQVTHFPSRQVVALVSVWRVLRGAREAGLWGGWRPFNQQKMLGLSVENDETWGFHGIYPWKMGISWDLSMENGDLMGFIHGKRRFNQQQIGI